MYRSLKASHRLAAACCGLALWAAGGSADAQNRRGFGNGLPNAAAGATGGAISVQIDGTLMAGNNQALRVQQVDGSIIAVALPNDARRISYVAEITPAELRPGMMVRFRTDMKSMQAGPVQPKGLELFVAEGRRGATTRDPRERSRVVPGIYPLAALGEVLPQSDEVRVVGQIAGAKDDKTMVVNAGRQVLVELAEDAALSFRSNSLTMARPGDSVTGTGITYNPQAGQVIASQLTVQAAGAERPEEKRPGEAGEASADGQPDPAAPAEGSVPAEATTPGEGGEGAEPAQGTVEKPTMRNRRSRGRPADRGEAKQPANR